MQFDLSVFELSTFTMLSIAVILGFYAAYAIRWIRLPSIVAYMAMGIILGPSLLRLFDDNSLVQFSFITEMALGFVAFTIGSELNMASLKRQGIGIVYIILLESFVALPPGRLPLFRNIRRKGALQKLCMPSSALTMDSPLSFLDSR